jgi:hypothetical protein
MIAKNAKKREDVVFYSLPFEYSFKAGTPDSVDFLYAFSNFTVDDLVTSQWKEIVLHKWNQQVGLHIFFAVLYWIYTIISTASLIFYKEVEALKITCFAFIAFFLLFDILQLITFSGFKVIK